MKLNTLKKGEKLYVAGLRLSSSYESVGFNYFPCDARKIGYAVEIEPKEYLELAKKSLEALTKIAGVEYKVFVKTKTSDWCSI